MLGTLRWQSRLSGVCDVGECAGLAIAGCTPRYNMSAVRMYVTVVVARKTQGKVATCTKMLKQSARTQNNIVQVLVGRRNGYIGPDVS